MREQAQGVVSRSVQLMGSKVTTWALAFAMTILVPRFLGPTAFGRLYFAISFTAIFSILVEFGLNSLVAREVSRKREDATRYIVNAAIIKGGLWLVAMVVMTAVVMIADYPKQTRAAVGSWRRESSSLR